MITLLCGPSGCGKSVCLRERIAAAATSGRRVCLLVPEQEALTREREIMSAIPPSAQLCVEVFNFSRLANHAFRHYGGISYRLVTPGARALSMWQTLRALSPFLSEYGSGQSEFALTSLMRGAVTECKAYGVTPQRLEEVAQTLPEDSVLSRKLTDLAMILGGYTARISANYDDGEDDLARLATLLGEHELFADTEVFVDSFTSFTSVELSILHQICRQATAVTVSLCCDAPSGHALHFTEVYRTAASLRRIAAMLDIPLKVERMEGSRRTDSATLAEIGERLWQIGDASRLSDDGSVELWSCADPYAEAEAAAARVSALVQGGMRYRDILLVVRDASSWRGILDTELERAGVPYFLSRRTDITTKPVIKLILSAFALRNSGWRMADFLTYLKTGCTGLARQEVDLLEDYITRWHLQGNAFSDGKPWTMDPEGYVTEHTEASAARLAQINAIRQRVLAPLHRLFAELEGAERAVVCAAALYEFLCEIDLPEQIKLRIARELEEGRDTEAAELTQLWNILIDSLDQIVASFGEDACSADDFGEAMKLLFAETDIGAIPTSADQVTIGSAAMLRADKPKCVILLGLCEGEFPQAMRESGFFSEQDKHTLSMLGIDLSPEGERRSAEELFYLYRAVTAPSDRLICLCHRCGTDGREALPSLAMSRISAMLDRTPMIWEEQPMMERLWAKETAFPYTALLADQPEGDALRTVFAEDEVYAQRLASLDIPLVEREAAISCETADLLFGNRMQLSQSRLDCYVGCHFSYFCRYLLGLRDERPAQIGYDSVGTYVHAVLERFFASLTKDGVLHLPQTDEEVTAHLDAVISAYLQDLFAGVPMTARITHLFSRLRRLAKLLIDHLSAEFRQSGFVPVFFELPIRRGDPDSPEPLIFDLPDGTPVWLGGVIDRVDLWQDERGQYYLRVVDYKTGNKPFDREDIDVGYNLQLLLYLFTLCRSKNGQLHRRLGLPSEAELTPAGMLYCSALAPDLAVAADADESAILKQADEKLTRRGIVLDDEHVLRAMDAELSGKYIPCRLLKQGDHAFSSPESRATMEEFGRLYDKLGTTIRRVAGELRAGRADANPRRHAGEYPCRNCPSAPICRAAKK